MQGRQVLRRASRLSMDVQGAEAGGRKEGKGSVSGQPGATQRHFKLMCVERTSIVFGAEGLSSIWTVMIYSRHSM